MTPTENIFIGVAWPYANGPQHIGHIAGVYLPADTFARFHRLKNNNVLMVSGSDTHGTPITLAAEKEGVAAEEVVARNHSRFINTYKALGVTFDIYTHTDTQMHWETAQAMFLTHLENKHLEVRTQKQLYDPKRERFLPDRYVEGQCPKCGAKEARGDQCDTCGETFHSTELINPRSSLDKDHVLDIRETEHFFFKLSEMQPKLVDYLMSDKSHWRNHVLNFSLSQVKNEKLEDRAVTRDIDWGVRIPISKYESKCLYVWYEAVVGYVSASKEWSSLMGQDDHWKKWWATENDNQSKSTYFLGKDNIAFHSLLWPAFLIAHGNLTLPYNVAANQHLKSYGKKFSKSRGVVISVEECLKDYQPDIIRYALTALAPENADTDFTWENFEKLINNELAANWGNLVQRVLTFTYRKMGGKVPQPGVLNDIDKVLLEHIRLGFDDVGALYEQAKLKSALIACRDLCTLLNQYINETTPWAVFKIDPERAATIIYVTLQAVDWLKVMWFPILPFSSEKIHQMMGYTTNIGGSLYSETIKDQRGEHEVIRYDHGHAVGHWEPTELLQGQIINEPEILFSKVQVPEFSDAKR